MPFLVYGVHGDLEDFLVICLKLTPHAHVKGIQALTNESIFSQAVSGVPYSRKLDLTLVWPFLQCFRPSCSREESGPVLLRPVSFNLYQLLWTSQFT